jgi:hypothetical protein
VDSGDAESKELTAFLEGIFLAATDRKLDPLAPCIFGLGMLNPNERSALVLFRLSHPHVWVVRAYFGGVGSWEKPGRSLPRPSISGVVEELASRWHGGPSFSFRNH